MMREDMLFREFQYHLQASAIANLRGDKRQADRLLEIALMYNEQLLRERLDFLQLCSEYEAKAVRISWH